MECPPPTAVRRSVNTNLAERDFQKAAENLAKKTSRVNGKESLKGVLKKSVLDFFNYDLAAVYPSRSYRLPGFFASQFGNPFMDCLIRLFFNSLPWRKPPYRPEMP